MDSTSVRGCRSSATATLRSLLVGGALLCLFAAMSASAAEPLSVRIGVLAKRGAEVTLKRWAPTADYLNARLPDYRFEIVPLDFDQIFPVAGSRKVDFILSNSAFYVALETGFGAFRIATLRTTSKTGVHSRFGGVIFTRRGRNDIRRLEDFAGKRFMGVEATSLGGYMAALREFHHLGIEPEKDFAAMRFGGTHDAVVYAVREGRVDGGTVRTDTLERMFEEGLIDLDEFKVVRADTAPPADDFPFLNSTRLYPEWPMAALPHVAPALVQQVTVALLNLPESSQAAAAARVVGWSVPANYQPVHDLLEELQLGPYEHLRQTPLVALLAAHPETFALLVLVLVLLFIYTLHVARLNRRLSGSESKLRGSLRQLEQARNQLIQSEKMAAIGQLSAGVAHEINNPIGYVHSNMNALEGYAGNMMKFCEAVHSATDSLPEEERNKLEALGKKLDIDYLQEDLNEVIAESREGVERVRKIVADLKDFARQDSGEWSEADINGLLASALNIVHNELKYKAEVVREFAEIPQVRCVASQVEQVFVNLLVNAAQAIEERGTITVRSGVSDDGEQVWVEVEDTGVGILEENLQQLFMPFFTTKPVGEGTGLGLSISYGIVQRHGGEIEVDSTPGIGSRFRVVLPVAGPDTTEDEV